MAVCTHCATPLPDGSHFCSHCGTPSPGPQAESDTLSPQSREVFERLKQATAGQYEILKEVGRGGMAIVFLGYQKSLDRQIAIKVLLPFLGFDTELVQRFLREARTQGKLDHPNIIKVYEVYNESGLTFFTMPYVSGPSLRALLEREPKLPLAKVHRYLCQAADALAYAHRRQVIHRDVKPDNMVLDEDRDSIILTDFGIAKALSAETTLTTPGDLLGTPHYMSPEQGEGTLDLDGRADQYSLGLVGYEMLVGQRPFEATSLAELMYKHRFENPEGLEALRPDVQLAFRVAVTRAIGKERADRFPTMDAFLAALSSCGELEADDQDPTEPMPPPGSGDTTLRVTTPPRRARSRTAGGGSQEGDFYPGWLDAPADVRAATSGAVSTAATRGRRGLRRVLLYGGGLAVAVTVGGLFLIGPLRPLLDRAGTGDSDSQPATVTPVEASDPSGATDAAPGDPESSGDAEAEVATLQGEESEPPAGEGEDSETDAGRTAAIQATAERAQSEAMAARQVAVEAGAALIFGMELAELDGKADEFDRMMAAAQFEIATPLFGELAGEFGELARRSEAAAADGGREAATARRDMQARREAAVAAGARRLALVRPGMIASQAREQFDAGNYGEAASLFRQAEQAYADLLPADEADPGARAEPGQPEGPALTAEQTISGLIERFGELFAQEDLPAMGVELYRRQLPQDDRAFLTTVFERADEIQVVRLERNLSVAGTSATADVRLRMRFDQSRTGASGERDVRFRMEFASGPNGWRLEALNPQR